MLRDLNNLYENGTIFAEENKNIVNATNKVSSEAKKVFRILQNFWI